MESESSCSNRLDPPHLSQAAGTLVVFLLQLDNLLILSEVYNTLGVPVNHVSAPDLHPTLSKRRAWSPIPEQKLPTMSSTHVVTHPYPYSNALPSIPLVSCCQLYHSNATDCKARRIQSIDKERRSPMLTDLSQELLELIFEQVRCEPFTCVALP